MNLFWLDASALVMRYSAERGSPQINLLLSQVSGSCLLLLLESVGEVISALVRKRNSGALTKHLFHQAITNFTAEIIYGPNYILITSRSEHRGTLSGDTPLTAPMLSSCAVRWTKPRNCEFLGMTSFWSARMHA